MRFTRIITGTIAAGLVGITPLAVSAPAHADGQTYTPTITAAISSPKAVYSYGEGFYVNGAITGPTAIDTPSGGQAALQIYTPSNPVWTTIATDDSPGYLYFDADLKFTSNAQFKVVYAGYTATSQFDDSYLAGESAVFTAAVSRNLVIKNPRGTFLKGKVSPDYKKKKVVIFKKVGKKYKKFRTVKTNKQSRFTTTLPASRKRTYFRITVPGDANFVAAVQQGSTISY